MASTLDATKSALSRILCAALIASSTIPLAAFERADEVRSAEWFLSFLEIDKAHKISTGTGISVALTDSGVNRHQDFINNLANGGDLTTSSQKSYDNDRIGHGTEMAGLIAGHGHGPAEGILGIAPASKIIPIKVSDGPEIRPRLGAGIDLAITLGAKVINVSSAGSISRELEESVEFAIKSDLVIVAGSGNDFRMAQIGYPAALPGVLAVGAVDRNGAYASFSTPGKNLGICAPGTDIVTTGPNSSYNIVNGTSAATAIVSGAAALVRAKFPELSAREVIHRLTATATDIGMPGRDEQCGYGVLNIVKALTADVPPLDKNAEPGVTPGTTGANPGPGSSSAIASDSSDEPGKWTFPALVIVAGVLTGGFLVGFLAVRRRFRKQE